MGALFTGIAAVVVILLIALIIAGHLIASSLRSRFPRLWHELGEPTDWFTAEALPPSRHFFTFLDSKRYLETQDPGFIRLCRTVRAGFYVFLVLMGTMILVGLAYVVLQSNPALHTDAGIRGAPVSAKR